MKGAKKVEISSLFEFTRHVLHKKNNHAAREM